MPATSRAQRLTTWLNDPHDPLWERPGPSREQQRNDILGAAGFVLIALLANVLAKSAGFLTAAEDPEASWRSYVAVAVLIVPLAWRRRAPLVVLLISSGLFVAMSHFSPQASPQLSFQAAYFVALYTAVAWARDRRLLWLAIALVLLTIAVWLVVMLTSVQAQQELGLLDEGSGPLSAPVGMVGYTVMTNLAYFGGAILIGRTSWRGALQRHRLQDQARTIREQAEELARNAVLDERMRIARELHDVVAHHVSIIGVQAGAARKISQSEATATTEALQGIESSSRQAVTEMRNLVGVLRSEEIEADGERSPEPNLADLDALAAEYSQPGRDISVARIETEDGELAAVPGPLGLSAYRIVQEALANVARHSTASTVHVRLRTGHEATGRAWLEVEVVDDGRLKPGSEGSGYGLRGITERVALHGGTSEIGPRATGEGWRVRVRFPTARTAEAR